MKKNPDASIVGVDGSIIRIGDKVDLAMKKGATLIQVTNITPLWIIFIDLNENNKRKDMPPARFQQIAKLHVDAEPPMNDLENKEVDSAKYSKELNLEMRKKMEVDIVTSDLSVIKTKITRKMWELLGFISQSEKRTISSRTLAEAYKMVLFNHFPHDHSVSLNMDQNGINKTMIAMRKKGFITKKGTNYTLVVDVRFGDVVR